MLRLLERIFEFCASLKLAILLILALAFYPAPATFRTEDRVGRRAAPAVTSAPAGLARDVETPGAHLRVLRVAKAVVPAHPRASVLPGGRLGLRGAVRTAGGAGGHLLQPRV